MNNEEYLHCDIEKVFKSIKLHNVTKEDILVIDKLKVGDMIHIYKQMMVIRHMDELMQREYKKNNVRGFCHLSIGQEGICAALERVSKNDMVVSSYRCHGMAYVTGCSIVEIMAELFGKQAGVCKGKGGSMHLYNKNFFGGHGIVGAQVPLGLGIAYALKYKSLQATDGKQNSLDQVCYVFYGDGAANQGQVWESFNMAMIWKLPAVFICENNRYGMWTPAENVSANTDFYLRGGAMPGIRIRDDDIFGLISVIEYGRNHALRHGPIIIQIDTYRLCGHSTVDQTEFYRAEDEIKAAEDSDCMKELERKLLTSCTRKELDGLRSEVCRQIEEELDVVKKGKGTNKDELMKDILLY